MNAKMLLVIHILRLIFGMFMFVEKLILVQRFNEISFVIVKDFWLWCQLSTEDFEKFRIQDVLPLSSSLVGLRLVFCITDLHMVGSQMLLSLILMQEEHFSISIAPRVTLLVRCSIFFSIVINCFIEIYVVTRFFYVIG